MLTANKKAIERLDDNALYSAAHIVQEGIECGIWGEEPGRIPNQFRKNLSKYASLMGSPDDFIEFTDRKGRTRHFAAYLGRRWKKAAGLVED